MVIRPPACRDALYRALGWLGCSCLLFLIFTFNLASAMVEKPDRELVLLNWSEYLDPEIIKEFELKHHVRVKEIYFETDDNRTDLLLETNGFGYDLVLCSGYNLHQYQQQGWLAPINSELVPNLKYIKPKWLNAFKGANGYAAPYFWGTLGIAYRKDLVAHEITSWSQLFDPAPKLSGKILMGRSVNDVVGMALKSLGYSANSHNPDEYKTVEKLLRAQKPHVLEYGYMSVGKDSVLVTGDVYMTMSYSGDALTAKEYEPQIEYVVPHEGGGIWVDYLAVMSSSNSKKLAYQFIHFLNEPKIAAQLAKYVYYASPNHEAEKFLDTDYLNNPIIYPNKEALSRSEFNTLLPTHIERKRNGIISRITD